MDLGGINSYYFYDLTSYLDTLDSLGGGYGTSRVYGYHDPIFRFPGNRGLSATPDLGSSLDNNNYSYTFFSTLLDLVSDATSLSLGRGLVPVCFTVHRNDI